MNQFNENDTLSSLCEQKTECDPKIKFFFFKSNISFHLAQRKAEDEKKKPFFGLSNAFDGSSLKKALNYIKGSKELIYQDIYEYRLEPFWLIDASREIQYENKTFHTVKLKNQDTKKVTVLNVDLLANEKNEIALDFHEQCEKKIKHSLYRNGLQNNKKEGELSSYLTFSKSLFEIPLEDISTSKKIKMLKDENGCEPIRINPDIKLRDLQKQMKDYLNSFEVTGNITKDIISYNKINIYFRPVFTFKYKWAVDNSDIFIEVDALTGEVVHSESWFKDKFNTVLSAETAQDILLGVGFEAMNKVVPFSGTATQAIYNKITNKTTKQE